MKKFNFNIRIELLILLILTFVIHPLSLYFQESGVRDDFNQMYLKGLRLIGAQKYNAAIAQFKEIIRRKPSSPKAYVKLAAVYEEIDELDEARQYFEKLIAKTPENPYAYHGLKSFPF